MGEIERWKSVQGYDGYYEVSDLGRIRSVPRTREVRNGYGGKNPRTDKGAVMTPINNGKGYLYVSLAHNGRKENHYVHRLVALAFCDGYSDGLVVDHRDGNRRNNRCENLEWVTQKENVSRAAHKMRGPRDNARTTNTGHKYISLVKKCGRKPVYRLYIRQACICRQFKTLDAALAYRKEVMEDA